VTNNNLSLALSSAKGRPAAPGFPPVPKLTLTQHCLASAQNYRMQYYTRSNLQNLRTLNSDCSEAHLDFSETAFTLIRPGPEKSADAQGSRPRRKETKSGTALCGV
jgi:hypothetical protein